MFHQTSKTSEWTDSICIVHTLIYTHTGTYAYTVIHTCLYGVVNAGPSSSMIGGREETSFTGSGSARSLPSSPNHFMH